MREEENGRFHFCELIFMERGLLFAIHAEYYCDMLISFLRIGVSQEVNQYDDVSFRSVP